MNVMRTLRLLLLPALLSGVAVGGSEAEPRAVIVLAGDPVRFDVEGQPAFTVGQLRNSEASTRAGLGRWSATASGKEIIAFFADRRARVIVTEDGSEEGAGRAPQPGLATLIAADRVKSRTFEVVLNPTFFQLPQRTTPLPDQPVTPPDMMAAAWAGEMLHVCFYARGISLPHHARADFQREWRAVTAELGMPSLRHDDADERGWRTSRAIVTRATRR
ncbi:MAG: hypothetical protein NVSMB68_01720 [Thermoanaerobaculia bacterium]